MCFVAILCWFFAWLFFFRFFSVCLAAHCFSSPFIRSTWLSFLFRCASDPHLPCICVSAVYMCTFGSLIFLCFEQIFMYLLLYLLGLLLKVYMHTLQLCACISFLRAMHKPMLTNYAVPWNDFFLLALGSKATDGAFETNIEKKTAFWKEETKENRVRKNASRNNKFASERLKRI